MGRTSQTNIYDRPHLGSRKGPHCRDRRRRAIHHGAGLNTYDASNAPSFASEISQAASIWNSSATNVRLQPGSPANWAFGTITSRSSSAFSSYRW
ncbi:snapalysin family zinc-dependent metalloprotease [Angustibacter sp. McL0619]|uniref:snapalysin family zinc-dependent metalloprotease n=1 Tax=Angustibacter sp. McL0619 TaxID=3415676 RepID=UPI003CF99546